MDFMNPVRPDQLTLAAAALFDRDYPNGFHCVGVIDGVLPGIMQVNDLTNPTWGFIRDGAYGTLFLGGAVDWAWLSSYIIEEREKGEVLLGIWQDEAEALKSKLPPLDYEGTVYDYTDRPMGHGLDELLRSVPEGCTLRSVDADLFDRLEDRDGILANFATKEKALAETFGACLLVGEEIASEAFGSPPVRGVIEMGIATKREYRKRGYGAITSAYLIKLCEDAGYPTYWNCNAANLPSVRLAKKLGYRVERPYTLFAWYTEE